jgi:hypothetical protein
VRQTEEEIQVHAQELFKLIDSVSKYKEHVVKVKGVLTLIIGTPVLYIGTTLQDCVMDQLGLN